jgi:uncharacterized membrane protein YeiB
MTSELSPVAPNERIESLDVVRGFALLGIFLMNVEFFNRSLAGIEQGMPTDLTGVDWFASWFVAYFVQGKFWTMFSTLFGMGFAVMLSRAERAERPFIAPYLRRTLALAVFGALHFILLWTGDILFSYAVGAVGLLILLYGRWKWITVALVGLTAIGFLPWLHPVWAIAGSLAFISLLAVYLRSDKKVLRLPVFSFIYAILSVLGTVLAVVLWVVPDVHLEPRVIVTMVAALFVITTILSARYRDPVERRGIRIGVAIYAMVALTMTTIGVFEYVSPPPPDDAATIAKQVEHAHHEEQVLSTGTYAEGLAMRASEFSHRVPNEAGFAVIVIGMFLIGVWFVRSGAIVNARDHLPLFRKLALYGIPIGVGLGLAGSAIATSHAPGDNGDGFELARALAMLGSLPACLGYIGLIVVAVHSKTPFAKIRVLAPAGRMALTNYLMQTLISTSIFYGYGGGQWGLARSWQVVYVVAVFTLQVVFSQWWLSRFRYGPMEWVWRAFTYLKLPEMRLHPRTVRPPQPAVQ